jgi:hypothetical protein
MVFHVALFRPRSDLSVADRLGLVEALEAALRCIPSVRRFHVGRRIRHGAGYEALMPVEFEFGAVLEFDDLAGLQAYLAHDVHVALGSRFMRSLDSSAIYDYQMLGRDDLLRLAQRG